MTDLVDQKPFLHAQIGADLLVDGPGEFAIQLPCYKGQEEGADTNNNGNSDQEGHDIGPVLRSEEVQSHQAVGGIQDLIELDGSIYQNSQVHKYQANDLNSVLRGESIVDEDELVDEGEDEETKVGRNSSGELGGRLFFSLAVERMSELDEDIATVVVSTVRLKVEYRILLTHPSKPKEMEACVSDITKKDHVHSEFGI